jgi:rod shape-determining protein MreC
MTAARIFSTNSSSWFNEFYIDKGLNDGIYEECNVLCGNGLMGIVTESYDNYAKVRAIIDDRSNIAAEITPAGAFCNVEGSLKTIDEGYLLVTDIDKDADIAVGDKVITSNISDRYFYGITIGYISEITMDSNNLTKSAKLVPAVDFSDVKDVLVITDRKQEVKY